MTSGKDAALQSSLSDSGTSAEANALPRVLRESGSRPDRSEWAPYGYGGNFWKRQIDSILRRYAIPYVELENSDRFGKLRLLGVLPLLALSGALPARNDRRSLGAAASTYLQSTSQLRQLGKDPVFIVESSGNFALFAAAEEVHAKCVVILAQVAGLWRRDGLRGWRHAKELAREIEFLRRMPAVFAISMEERWLLRNFGIDACYLPYFPDPEREQELLMDRDGRSSGIYKGEFLIVASRGNSDVVESFREQAQWIRESVSGRKCIFHVCGNGSEYIRDIWVGPAFQFHGTCSDETMRMLKRRVQAICIHSVRGVGAMTRIPDMLVSGIPVIANAIAARSYHSLEGVNLYETPDEFARLCNSVLAIPSSLCRPDVQEKLFATRIIELLGV